MNIFMLIICIVFNFIFTWVIVGDLFCWFIHNIKAKAFLVILALLSAHFWRLIYISIYTN